MHIKINGVSLCRTTIPHDLRMEALDEHIPFSCHVLDNRHATELMDFLFAHGYNPELIDGPCDQQDDSYWYDEGDY